MRSYRRCSSRTFTGAQLDREGVARRVEPGAFGFPCEPMSLNVGDRLGHCDVTALMGEGGMGQVYEAT